MTATTKPRPILPDQLKDLIGKSFWDIQGCPIQGGWSPVVKGRAVDLGHDSLRGIPPSDAIIADFVDSKGASYVIPSIMGKKRRKKMVLVTVSQPKLDYLVALLAQTTLQQAVGASKPVAAIRKAVDDLIEQIERNRVFLSFINMPPPPHDL